VPHCPQEPGQNLAGQARPMDDLTREFLIESQEGLDRMERCLTDLEERPQDIELLAEIFRSVHTIKGTTGFLGFRRLEKLAHSGENLLGLLRDGKLSANQSIINGLLQLLDGLRGILHNIEVYQHEGEGFDEALIGRLDELQYPDVSGVEASFPHQFECSVENGPATSEQTAAIMIGPPFIAISGQQDAAINPAAPGATGAKASTASDSTLRVDVTLLNRLMNLVGELVLTRNQILQTTSLDSNLTVLSRRLDMVTADLREAVMKARMQPVSYVFSKFPRIIRDLTQTLNRRVRLVVEGQETELDKSLLEAIKDPLTHAVRNSLDHGIEPADVRIACGKEPEGTLKLRAYQESSHVIIEISDDGAGIAVDKVRNRAIERGLITSERAAHLADRELMQLIFLPGFSTAESVTNVSGRGVGMDIVRTNVEKIGGKVEIESRPGRGTTLRLRIPLTLAIIPALIVHSLNQSFAIPQGALSELVHIPKERIVSVIEWMEGSPLYRLRGHLLPLIFLDQMLDPTRGSVPSTSAAADPFSDVLNETAPTVQGQRDDFIAVLDVDGRRFGLVVDGLADPEEIVVKPLSAVLKSIGYYSGATVLGSGDLALILDPGALAAHASIAMTEYDRPHQAIEPDHATAPTSAQYLLVETAERRAAVPLDDVLRIERVPVSRIEYADSRPVLNFAGRLLPVQDSTGELSRAGRTAETPVTVVVCCDGNRNVGIAVTNVLDVATGGELFEAGSERRASGVTLLNERVTNVVALDSVPSLPSEFQSELIFGSDWIEVSAAKV